MLKMFFFIVITFVFLTTPQASVSVVDDKGRIVEMKKPAERIISLAPHITESLFSAGAGDKIIGAVSYSDYPEQAKKIPRVGGYPTIDLEKIISLKPDLVIAWASGNNANQIERLITMGVTVFMSDPKLPEDIAKTIQRFGVLAGKSDISSRVYDDFMQHYSLLKNKFSNKKKVNVFYQIWNKPLVTINGKHLISSIINLCGGVNVFSDLYALTPKVSLESVLSAKVDVVLLGAEENKKTKWRSEWESWLKLSSSKKEQAYFINPDLLNRAGPRILDGADKLCDILDQARKN